MKEKNISIEDATNILDKKENHFLDFKSKQIKPSDLMKTIVAFSNAEGGDVYIGIEDEKSGHEPEERWKGVDSIESFNSIFQQIAQITPTPQFKAYFLTCDSLNGIVLLLNVEKSRRLHKCSDGKYYIRESAQSLPLNDPEKIRALEYAKGISSFEDELVIKAKLERITESKAIKNFLDQVSPQMDALEYIINDELADPDQFIPKVSGLLLFSDNPAIHMPTLCSIKIARYETREEDPERDNLSETYTLEGNTYKLIHDTVQLVTDIMSKIPVLTPEGLRPMQYPPEAIWEIFVNAFIHRDYSISDHIKILIFDDRIQVISPGKLPFGITPGNIVSARFSRNKQIVRTLARYKNPPNKDMGEGMDTAFQKMKEWKLQDPIIEEIENYVSVTIPHKPLARPEELVINFLRRNDSITNKQGRLLTGIRSENAMKNVFYKIRDLGYIKMDESLKGNKAAWIVIKLPKEDEKIELG
ncbi:ATP-dependent DNA helicase RecG [Chromobacterium alkanivorans]|uniref:RNA-binding domain-containing protein n=1 Tax=Chromobacterium alkanivorans TaxID=1071719 RepID=UPI0021677F0E|nr:RNA-binding domain-containing protein [Chromobacterium alkanivorans]MCS3803752.1 ATP-dependent DNA helicase RecG [Chromobacterium alkanivorans]MCS3818143.1 ATP-dependent DNA helicase RecG [Chromobacterium alkanivorans]MCS3874658.1 ATP-dependent DNA helicase RecG [Chromobacterium alkanivorans]